MSTCTPCDNPSCNNVQLFNGGSNCQGSGSGLLCFGKVTYCCSYAVNNDYALSIDQSVSNVYVVDLLDVNGNSLFVVDLSVSSQTQYSTAFTSWAIAFQLEKPQPCLVSITNGYVSPQNGHLFHAKFFERCIVR